MKPVGPTFHRSFPLQRSVLSSYLNAVCQLGDTATAGEIRALSRLGTMKIPAALGYGKGTGLLTSAGGLSEIGQVVVQGDPGLLSATTQWLLHAGIAGLSDQAPAFWPRIWGSLARGSTMSREDLEAEIMRSYVSGAINLDSAKVSATAFVSSYRNADGLQSLGLLEVEGASIGSPYVEADPPVSVFACALVTMWSRIHADQLGTGLEWFMSESGLGRMFRVGHRSTEKLLEESAALGVVDLYRSAPPFSIVRRWNDPAEVLGLLYADA